MSVMSESYGRDFDLNLPLARRAPQQMGARGMIQEVPAPHEARRILALRPEALTALD